jgi:CubicO group peptidase (beta-lactamase class C family)
MAFASASLTAQNVAAQGDFVGTLGPLTLKLHIKAAPDGHLTGTLDSPTQGANGILCTDFVVEGSTLSFKVPAVTGTWSGAIESGGGILSGTWSQGTPLPLTFSRDTFELAATPSAVDGIWLGSSQFQGRSVRTQLIVESGTKGEQRCTVDSPDLGVFGLGCANVMYSKDDLAFDVPSVQAGWHGKLSADGRKLSGTWTQQGPGAPAPSRLDFDRQTQRVQPVAAARPTYLPAAAPVSAADMQAVLRRDLDKTLTTGLLALDKPIGVAIGVVRDGQRSVFALGAAKPDSVFEIGSITKTFTGLLMARMVEQGKVTPDTPVRKLLPSGTVAKPSGREITVLDLVTQHSGLPRLPDNFAPANAANPYVDYREANLYQFLGKHGVEKPSDAAFLYSNLGFGLLGQALANRAGEAYPELIAKEVLRPLGMIDSAIALTADQQRRFIPAHLADLSPGRPWEFSALAGCGALRSTASDLLKYLEANMDPAKLPTLSAAFARSHELLAEVGPGSRIGYAWIYDAASGSYWHDGGTGGFTSFVSFNPRDHYAGVVLANVALNSRGNFADLLGQHIQQRLAGQPAVSLDAW